MKDQIKTRLVLSEEQKMLKASAAEFFRQHAPVSQLRKLRDSKDELGYDKEVYRLMSEMGWTALILPEKYDGLDFGYVGLGQVLEESGRTLAASPLISTVLMASTAILRGGSEEQKRDLLPRIASGQLIACLAHEEDSHHNSGIGTNAKRTGEQYVITGNKKFVIDGHASDKILVSASLKDQPGQLGLFNVDAKSDGVTVRRRWMMDSRNMADIEFDEVVVNCDSELSENAGGAHLIKYVLNVTRIGLAAEMLGTLQEAFERTIGYLKERRQFGLAIGSFQALQHRAAHMFCEIELCKTLVLKSLMAIDRDEDLAVLSSMTKSKVGEVLQLVTNEAIQMYGGIGVTDEEDIGLFMKRARVAQQSFGDYNYHLRKFAELKGF